MLYTFLMKKSTILCTKHFAAVAAFSYFCDQNFSYIWQNSSVICIFWPNEFQCLLNVNEFYFQTRKNQMTAEFFINMSQIFIYKHIGSIVMNLRQSIRNSFYLKTNTVAWKKRARLKKLQCRPHRRLDMRNLYTHINRARKVGYTYLSSYLAFLKSRCDVATELIATFSKSAPQILGVIHLIH